jgi:predicted CoA-binding protein
MLADMNEIKTIIEGAKVIAIVGLSPKENRPSNLVGRYLQDANFTIIPVNPGQAEILGETCYPTLTDIPVPVDVVDIFRRPEDVVSIVEEAITIGAKTVWMQFGVVNEKAAALAHQAGLKVVMDRCLKIDHNELL